MKKSIGKTVIAVAVVLIAALAVITLTSTQKNQTVVFIDSTGKEIGTAEYDGKNKTVKPVDEGYRDYISLALEEAERFYGEKNKDDSNNPTENFFANVSLVETNFSNFYYEKIRDGIAETGLEADTPFASVLVDRYGRVLASCGYKGEDETVYSLYKTYAGSSIKPLSVYAPAIEKGTVHWSTPVKDKPIKKIKLEAGGEQEWPLNSNGSYTGEDILVCDAVYQSCNTVAVRVLQKLGLKTSIELLDEKLGLELESEKRIIETQDDEEIYGNIALGYLIDGVSPLEMAGYYQIFINSGRYTEPYAVASLTDIQGNVIEKTPESKRIISSATASVMAKLLQGVVKPGGTGKDADVPGMNIAGKTGTSSDNYDNWFVGFTPKAVCSVWHGYNDEEVNSSHLIFSNIFKRFPPTDSNFGLSKEAEALVYCKKSGDIKGSGCYDTAIGYYISGKVPGKCKLCR